MSDPCPSERLVCAGLASAARVQANHLATAIEQARARGAATEELETRLSILLDYEHRLTKRSGSTVEARFEPTPMGGGA